MYLFIRGISSPSRNKDSAGKANSLRLPSKSRAYSSESNCRTICHKCSWHKCLWLKYRHITVRSDFTNNKTSNTITQIMMVYLLHGRNNSKKKKNIWLCVFLTHLIFFTQSVWQSVHFCVSHRQSYRRRAIVKAEEKDKEAVIDKKKQDESRIQISN